MLPARQCTSIAPGLWRSQTLHQAVLRRPTDAQQIEKEKYKIQKLGALSIAMLMILTTTVIAQAGLDPTFGEGGLVTLDAILGVNSVDQHEGATGTAIDEQGRNLIFGRGVEDWDDFKTFEVRLMRMEV